MPLPSAAVTRGTTGAGLQKGRKAYHSADVPGLTLPSPELKEGWGLEPTASMMGSTSSGSGPPGRAAPQERLPMDRPRDKKENGIRGA